VIEILEYVSKPSDEEALQYHFADLVDGTGDSTNIIAQERVEMLSLPYVLLFLFSVLHSGSRHSTEELSLFHCSKEAGDMLTDI
jgi:hypothetical protein